MSAITKINYTGRSDGSSRVYNETWKVKCDTPEEAKLAYLLIKAINEKDTVSLEYLKSIIEKNELHEVVAKIKKHPDKDELKNILSNINKDSNTTTKIKDKVKETLAVAPIKLIFTIIAGIIVAFLVWYFGLK